MRKSNRVRPRTPLFLKEKKMGRPVNKRYFGATGGDGATVYTSTGPKLPIRFKLGGVVYEGKILKQVGSSRYRVSTDDNTTALGRVVLTNTSTPANNGEGALIGFHNGQATPIKRLYNRRAKDFNGRYFKWSLSDDSTETLMILTLIS